MMTKTKTILACVLTAAVVLSAGGCVSKATHNRTLAELSDTQVELNETQTDLTASRTQCRNAEADNLRLKEGLSRLAISIGGLEQSLAPVLSRISELQKSAVQLASGMAPAPVYDILAAAP